MCLLAGAARRRYRIRMKLDVVVASTRPGRVGLPVAEWFVERAKAHGRFEVELVDLKAIDLPHIDEPKHPRLGEYQHEHTKRWSAIARAADAFVFVTPEYNYGLAPALVNALDYLFNEWTYKPVGFVSYGGMSGGTRSVQMVKQIVTTLKMMPIPEAVAIPFITSFMKEGAFAGTEQHAKSAVAMLDELVRWAGALATLRA
jgi:NAD(P)H-dependent FMN reductase